MHRRPAVLQDPVAVEATLRPRLMVYEFRQDDPKKCTSVKLRKFRLVRQLSSIDHIPRSAIVLNPTSNHTLSRSDRDPVLNQGLVALDCSWNLSEEVFYRKFRGEGRRLPKLLAGNPTNYGVTDKLSTAEALAAALFILGFGGEARKVLSLFKWGDTFFTLNQEPLESYAKCSPGQIAECEREFFGPR